jgi:hypothetical protein
MRFLPYIVIALVQLYVIVEASGTRFPRLMPRWAWTVFSIMVPVISAVLWFVSGRPRAERQIAPDDLIK